MARNRVEDALAVTWQEPEYTQSAANLGLTTAEPETTFHAIMVVIRHSLSEIASSDDGEDGADEDDEVTEQGQLNEDYEHC